MGELGKIAKNKDMSPESNTKIIRTLVCPITKYKHESWTVKKAIGIKMIHSVRGELWGYPGKELNKWVLELINPKTSLDAKMTKLKLSYSRHIMRRQGFLEKTIMLRKI